MSGDPLARTDVPRSGRCHCRLAAHARCLGTEWEPANHDLRQEYKKLLNRFNDGVKTVKMADSDAEWAVSPRQVDTSPRQVDTGHSIPGS